MRKVYAHVGSNRDGLATDPAAIQGGIRADIDQWRTDVVNEQNLPVEARREIDYFVLGFDRSALERYMAGFEPPPGDREIRFEHVKARPGLKYGETREHWRTYYVLKTPMLDTRAISDVRVEEQHPVTGEPMLWFLLTRDGQQAFMKGTAAAVGKKIATMIDGDIMSAPIIDGAVKGGRFSLTLESSASANALLTMFQCVKSR